MSTRHPSPRLLRLALLAPLMLLGACRPDAPTTGQGLVIQNPQGERDYFIDFGSVVTGETVEHVFEVKNTDPGPITIADLTPSCSCTSPRVSYMDAQGQRVRSRLREKPVITIPAGVTARVEISIDTNHVARKNVDKLAMVVLRCDSPNKPFMTFEMHLVATQAYQVTPRIMNLGDIPISSGSRSSVDLVIARPGGLDQILGVASHAPGLEVTIEEVALAAETLWRVQAVLHPPLSLGAWRGQIALRTLDITGHDEIDPFVIEVLGHVVPDVVLFPPALRLSAAGEQLEAKAVLSALAAGHRVRIVEALISGDVPESCQLSYEPQAPDSSGRSSRWNVTIAADSKAAQESFVGLMQFTLEDPEQNVVEGKFIYRPE